MHFKKWSRFLNQHALIVTVLFLLLTLLSSYFVVKLYANLKPDIEELLPTTSRSVVDLKEVTRRLRSIDNLAVIIETDDSETGAQFQKKIASEFEKLPAGVAAQVEYRITDELHFFARRKALFISTADLSSIYHFIKKRIDYEEFIANPINLVIENKPTEPKYDFEALEKRYATLASEYAHLPDGVYSSQNGLKRLILIYAPDQSIETAHRLKDSVSKIIQQIQEEPKYAKVRVKYSGNIQDIIEEQAALMADLLWSTIWVTVLVFLVLFIYFRSWIATVGLVFSLLVGTIITFGIAYFSVGYLNANSAFLGSIVMGNGINFGIMVLARYLEERRGKGALHESAIEIALRETLLPTLTAALAAGLSYGSLMLTSFRGFSQFGVIGFIGMVVCWICAYTFLPAMLSLLNRYFSLLGRERRVESRTWWTAGLVFLLKRWGKVIAIAGGVLTLFFAFSLTKLNGSIIESDLTKLRDKHSMEQGSGFFTREVDEILKRYSSPIAILAETDQQAELISERLKQFQVSEGVNTSIKNVVSVQDFIPADQSKKINILKSIKEMLNPRIWWHLSDAEKKKVKEFISPETLAPFSVQELPTKLLDRFREKDGSVNHLVLVEPPLTDQIREGNYLLKFVKNIRQVVDQVGLEVHQQIPVAGRLPVSADMLSAILKEGPIATLVSFLAVILLTLLIFRNIELSILVIGALLMGVLWMVGVMIVFQIKINFLNFIALPITFGIGVDYAVNVFHRYRSERKFDCVHTAIVSAVTHTGGAVILASFTTIIGWSSLLIAGNQAFVSFGKIAVLGEVTCVGVAVLVIPSFLLYLWKKNPT